MPRPRTAPELRFSDTRIRELPFAPLDANGGVTYRDTEIKGLYLIVYREQKTFRVNLYFPSSGKPRNLKLGNFPDLSVDAARRLAMGYLTDRANRIDPVVEKEKKVREAPPWTTLTLRSLRDQFVADGLRSGRLRESTATKLYTQGINLYGGPLLDLAIPKLTKDRVVSVIRELRDTPGRGGASRDTTLGNFLRCLVAIFNYAEKNFGTTNSPVFPDGNPGRLAQELRLLRKSKPKSRVLSTKELPIFFRYLKETSSLSRPIGGSVGQDALIMLLLTGARREEVLGLKWSAISDLESPEGASVLFEKTKTNPRRIPLGPFLTALLRTRKNHGRHSGFVFPTESKKGYLSEPKNLFVRFLAQQQKAGVEFKKFSSHDLRRTFISHALLSGADRELVQTIVGHTVEKDTTAKHYTQLGEDVSPKLRQTMTEIEEYLIALCHAEGIKTIEN